MEGLDRPAWNPPRQCTGTNRAGGRCQRNAIAGGDVCVMHGGAAPQVREAAKLRLLALVEPVITVFEEVVALWHGTRCATCGRPTGDPAPVIRIGQLVLDRTGFHPSLQVQVQSEPKPNPYANITPEELEARALRLVEMARAMRLPPMHPGAVEGVVDEGFEIPNEDQPIPVVNATPEEGTGDK